MPLRLISAAVLFALAATSAAQAPRAGKPAARADAIVPHNVVLFVPDGLRALQVTPHTAPTMAAIRDRGVSFKDPHSIFPTLTTANASAMATGHQLGDTGDFSNTIYTGYPVEVPDAPATVTPFLESDPVLGDVDAHFAGDYLDEETILKAARERGWSTAAIGKLGPTLIFDHTERTGERTIIVDDLTGRSDTSGRPLGIPLSDEMKAALAAAGLPPSAPSRGENQKSGNRETPGTRVANITQQAYFTDVAVKAVLPLLKARNKPFLLVFWSRDPDGTQHNQGDSLNALTPGINGPTSLAAVKNADDNLRRLQEALHALELAATTDIIVAADHGFSTISKQSRTSPAAAATYRGVVPGFLPPGFLALDLAKALELPLHHASDGNPPVEPGTFPKAGNGILGHDPAKPDVVVAANGGSDLVYLPNGDHRLAARIVDALLAQDYVGGIFVDDALGTFAGTLPLSAINLHGHALTPRPAIVVSFRSFASGCNEPLLCAVEIADTGLQQGQGMHGSFSRADTMNFIAAIGPDFKTGFVDEAPVSNADIGRTIAALMGLELKDNGRLIGRVIEEAMPGGAIPKVTREVVQSKPAANGLRTVLAAKRVGETLYLDAAGFPGRTVGLPSGDGASQ
jgi:hypothetical protein